MGYFLKDSSLWSQDVFARSVNSERRNLIPRDRGRKGRFFHGSYFLNRLPDRPNSNRIWVIAWSKPFLCRDCLLCWLMLSGKKDGDLIGRESCSSSSPFLSSDWSAEKGVDGRRYKNTLFFFSLLQAHSSKAKASSPLPSLPDPGSSPSSWISDSYGRQGEAAPAQPPQWKGSRYSFLKKSLWSWNSHFHCNCKRKKKGWMKDPWFWFRGPRRTEATSDWNFCECAFFFEFDLLFQKIRKKIVMNFWLFLSPKLLNQVFD